MSPSMDSNEKSAGETSSPVTSVKKPLTDYEENEYFLPISTKTNRLPPWLDHFNSRDLKVLFKCCAAVWVMTLFILIEPTLKVIGQATFFGVLVLYLAPPSGVVFTGLLAGLTLLVGMCLAWAWGVITMKAALATRPTADLNARYQQLAAMAPKNTTNSLQASGQATYQQIAIYDGFMLDTRVTVTYFCMMGLFIYLVARIRVAAPKLTLLSMFGLIVSNVFLTIGPLIPTFNGTIARSFIIPASIGVGLGMVCNILFFPRSTSHTALDNMQDMLKPMDTFLRASATSLNGPGVHMEFARLKQTKSQVISSYKALEGNLAFLPFDASVCRWSAGDVKSLQKPLQRVLAAFVTLLHVQLGRAEHKIIDKWIHESPDSDEKKQGKQKKTISSAEQNFVKAFDFRRVDLDPDQRELIEKAFRNLSTSSKELFALCEEAVLLSRDALRDCNSRRWFGRPSPEERATSSNIRKALLAKLQEHLNHFSEKGALHLRARQDDLRIDLTELQSQDRLRAHLIRSIILSLVLEDRIYKLGSALHGFLSRIVALNEQRPDTKFWPPGSFKKMIPWTLEKDTDVGDGSAKPLMEAKDQVEAPTKKQKSQDKKSKKAEKKNIPLDSAKAILATSRRRGTRQRSKLANLGIGLAHWFGSTEGLYGLRVLVVTLGLAVLAVNRTTAGFFYREKGLWALIMAQTSLLPYTADFVIGFLSRMASTVIGACVGLAVWYIGAGNGPGNPYGMAAILLVPIIIGMWLRLFTSPAFLQAIVFGMATVYLVMAYSWVDTHIPSYGNPGVGYEVFWRRMLLVMIGFCVGAFVTFFPRPPSANRHYRRVLSESLGTFRDQYTLFVASCHKVPTDLREVSENLAINTADILLQVEPLLRTLKFEFSTSNFDSKTLGVVCHLCMNLNQYITQLTLYTSELDEEVRKLFLQASTANTERTTTDILTKLAIVANSLKTADPLPAALSVPLMDRVFPHPANEVSDTTRKAEVREAFRELFERSDSRRYCSAMTAFAQILTTVDELVVVVARVVGETNRVDNVAASEV